MEEIVEHRTRCLQLHKAPWKPSNWVAAVITTIKLKKREKIIPSIHERRMGGKNSIKWFISKNFLTLNTIFQFETQISFFCSLSLSPSSLVAFQISILWARERERERRKATKIVFVLLPYSLIHAIACRLLSTFFPFPFTLSPFFPPFVKEGDELKLKMLIEK